MGTAIVHHSRIDTWLLVTLLASAALSTWVGIVVLAGSGRGTGVGSAAIAVMIVMTGAALPLWLLLDTRYTLADGWLVIRCGPFRSRVALDEIDAITPSRNPVSSPALSLDRLRIDHGRGRTVLISPRDPSRFIADVEAMRAISGASG